MLRSVQAHYSLIGSLATATKMKHMHNQINMMMIMMNSSGNNINNHSNSAINNESNISNS